MLVRDQTWVVYVTSHHLSSRTPIDSAEIGSQYDIYELVAFLMQIADVSIGKILSTSQYSPLTSHLWIHWREYNDQKRSITEILFGKIIGHAVGFTMIGLCRQHSFVILEYI